MEEATNIFSLPDEVIIMILQWTSYADCNRFMKTCKQYNDLLKSSQSLWRAVYRETVSKDLFDVSALYSDGDWLADLKKYIRIRDNVIQLLDDMSRRHFREARKDVAMKDMSKMFALALSGNRNYYRTISSLQQIVKKAADNLNSFKTKKPYTMTEIHYSKISLCYLTQILFGVKWVQQNLQDQADPEVVLNFFLQWIDPTVTRKDEEVCDLIHSMVKDVDLLLAETNQLRFKHETGSDALYTCPNGVYTEKQVISAISEYLYKRRCVTVADAANIETLDIVKAVKTNNGHALTWGSIYQAIARGFGVTSCHLIAFPSHMYLQWRTEEETLIISLEKGDLRPSRSCPFSTNTPRPNNYSYSAESLLQYTIKLFLRHQDEHSTWNAENATKLLYYFTNEYGTEYWNFLGMLRSCALENGMSVPFNVGNVPDEHLGYVRRLLHLNEPLPPIGILFRDMRVKHHVSCVKYAVGMICYHRRYGYLCVVRDWDSACEHEAKAHDQILNLTIGPNQPFYYIVAVDQGDRYIAQETLIMVPNPSRIKHLEHFLGKEFSHYNGFFYEPNPEKQALYPDDMNIANMYAEKAHCETGSKPSDKKKRTE